MPSAVFNKKQGKYVIPAQHTDRLREALDGTDPMPTSLDQVVQQVFSADYSEIISIPAVNVLKLPKPEQKAARLVLCANFTVEDPSKCSMGERCKFVHANIEGASHQSVHINYAWTSLDAVTYERFAPGKSLKVAAPSSKTITDVMESHMVLKTKALSGTRRPMSHCAHYYFNRTCNLGSDCQFIHAVFIDPTAKPYQRAPAPTQLGRPRRGREPRQSHGATDGSHEGIPVDELSPAVAPAVFRSPGGESSSSDHYTPAVGDHRVDPLTAAMLTPQATPTTTPSATPTRRCATPQAVDIPFLEYSPSVNGMSYPGQPGSAIPRENSGSVSPSVRRHTPYGSRQNSFAL